MQRAARGAGDCQQDSLSLIQFHLLKLLNNLIIGGMGRFLDDGNYAKDIVEGAIFKVRQIRIAKFINDIVATRRYIYSYL